MIDEGVPFRAPKGAAGGKSSGTEAEIWFPFDVPVDWNGVMVLAHHPTFHEMRRLEQHPGEFIGVMRGEAYTLLTSHILQKIGLHWEKCLKANLVPWYVPPKRKVSPGQERYGFQFIDRLIKDYSPKLVLAFGASIAPHLAKDRGPAGVTELQGQLLNLPQYPGTVVIRISLPNPWFPCRSNA